MTDARTLARPPAVILAGGLARRMGGCDKCLIEVGGRTLLDHALDRLKAQAAPIAINANGDAARFAPWGLPVIADEREDRPGPLAGVLAAMVWAAEREADHVLTVAGDTPFFPRDLAARLSHAITPETPIALAATPDARRGLARHPTFGLWPTHLAADLRAGLAEGVRKVVAWTDRHGAASVRFEADAFDPFFNVNTPDDRDGAERIAAEHHP